MAVKKKYDNVSRFEVMEFECSPKEAKVRIDELRATGLVIGSFDMEPVLYKYKVKYVAPAATKEEIETEEWRDIPGKFYGRYQVSNLKRLRRLRILADYGTIVLEDADCKRWSVKVDSLHKLAFK